jgi:hypothetical protein
MQILQNLPQKKTSQATGGVSELMQKITKKNRGQKKPSTNASASRGAVSLPSLPSNAQFLNLNYYSLFIFIF